MNLVGKPTFEIDILKVQIYQYMMDYEIKYDFMKLTMEKDESN